MKDFTWIIENKMEATSWGLKFRLQSLGFRVLG